MAKSNPIILKDEEITERMRELPGWKYHDNKLSKEFEFKTFVEGINFINNLTLFCEQIDHHPDMHIFYTNNRVHNIYTVTGSVALRVEIHIYSRSNILHQPQTQQHPSL